MLEHEQGLKGCDAQDLSSSRLASLPPLSAHPAPAPSASTRECTCREFHAPTPREQPAPTQPAPFNLRTERRGKHYERAMQVRNSAEWAPTLSGLIALARMGLT